MLPKISIILPCYNVEKYIAKSIESILEQSFPHFELLIVVDGSPDSSKLIAEEFALRDSRIAVYEKENGGLSDARNYGLERAKGDYVYFMDSDDWIEPMLLEDILAVISEEKLDLVIFGYIQDNENQTGKVVSSSIRIPENKIFRKEENNLIIDRHLLGILGYAWNKIYKKEFLLKHKLRFEKGTSLVEDILFNTQVYSKTDLLRTIDKAYYHYLNRPVTTLIKKFHPNSFELKKQKNQFLKLFFDAWKVRDSERILSYCIVQGIRYCVHNLFSFKNNLSFQEKKGIIKKMLNDSITEDLIPYYVPVTLKDKMYKYLIQHKQGYIIAIVAKYTK